ncbi:MAG: hypothetical protein ACXU86_22675, partial [Archangium sp.]
MQWRSPQYAGQSCGQVVEVSEPEQVPSPQELQSEGQLERLSLLESQMPSPQEPQSLRQELAVSPRRQLP